MNTTPIPAVSVILPVFNGREYLKHSIASVLQQDFTDFELLVGDDHSRDDSVGILQDFSDTRIRAFQAQDNTGLFANLNGLIARARAPLIRFLCQDDSLEHACLAQEVDFFKAHPEIGMSFCKATIIDGRGRMIEKNKLGDLPDTLSPQFSMQLFFYFGCIPGNLSTVCVRKDSLLAYGTFDQSYKVSGDYELWVRICQNKALGVIQRHLVCIRNHPEQLSRARASGVSFIKENRLIRDRIAPLLPESIRAHAARYITMRQLVSDTHYCLKCLSRARFNDFFNLINIIGIPGLFTGLLFWVLTLNNHLFRPREKFFHAPDAHEV